MANWGGLNNALNAWRNGVNQRFPDRSTKSDGGYADSAHSSNSQHQPDSDGTVDAFDMDVNLFNSSVSTGDTREKKYLEALKKDFEYNSRSHLWIHNRIISQDDEGWDNDSYSGESPHTEHIHFEANQAKESDGSAWKFPNTDALLEEEMALDFNDTKEAAKQGAAAWWAAELVGLSGMSPETAIQRMYGSTLLGTNDADILKKRLDATDAAILRIEENQERILEILGASPPTDS
jgi:hypothetical protein